MLPPSPPTLSVQSAGRSAHSATMGRSMALLLLLALATGRLPTSASAFAALDCDFSLLDGLPRLLGGLYVAAGQGLPIAAAGSPARPVSCTRLLPSPTPCFLPLYPSSLTILKPPSCAKQVVQEALPNPWTCRPGSPCSMLTPGTSPPLPSPGAFSRDLKQDQGCPGVAQGGEFGSQITTRAHKP